MLNLWVGKYPKEWESKYIICNNPDVAFDDYFNDFSIFETDLAFRVLKDCSCAKEMIPPAAFRTIWGNTLPVHKASSGAKVIFLLMTLNCVCDWEWCGDNCNKYIAEVASKKDITMYSTRYVDPFAEADNLECVKLINNGETYYNGIDYTISLARNGLM